MLHAPWLTHAYAYLGEKEISGPKDNPKIVEMFRMAGHPEVVDDETAWCAAFVGACLNKAKIEGTGTLWALDYARWGQKLLKPILGCIAVKHRDGGGGHVTFPVGKNATHIFCLGGNQRNEVNISAYPINAFQYYRWAPGIDVPSDPPIMPKTIEGARRAGSEA